jgi:hypothetical protein
MSIDESAAIAIEPGRLYSSLEVCQVAGITYRQLDYWVRIGRFTPEVAARGSGSQRKFSASDVRALIFMAELMRFGAQGQAVHSAVRTFRVLGAEPGPYLIDAWGHVFDLDEAPPMAGWVVVIG